MTTEIEPIKSESTITEQKLPFKRNDGSNPLKLPKELLYIKKKELDELTTDFPNLPRDIISIAWDAHYIENKDLYKKYLIE